MSTVKLTQISTGAPGVGKGTQCTRLAKDLGVKHMCVGDLLRGDPECESIMKKAGLVNYDKVRVLLRNVLDSHLKAGQKNILLDGFPRSPEQAHFFQAEVHFQSRFCDHEADLVGVHRQKSSALPLPQTHHARTCLEERSDLWKSG